MRSISRFTPHAITLVFAVWCVFSVRNDLAQLSLATLIKSWDLVALATLLSLMNYTLRIFRWRYYLAKLGHAVSYRFAALTYCAGFAYTLSPGKIGEMVRARYYVRLGVPLADVTAAFFAERLMDLVAMTGLAMLIFTASRRYNGAIGAAVAIIGAILATLAVVPWPRLSASIRQSAWLPNAIRSAVAGFATALATTRALLRPGVLAAGLAFALLAWGLEGAGLGVLSSMFPSTTLSLTSFVGIYAIAVLIGALSFLPGGLGSTEAAMTALLVANGRLLSQALLLTLTCRLLTLWLAVGLGWIAVWTLHEKRALAVKS